jgi:hypothetical protein
MISKKKVFLNNKKIFNAYLILNKDWLRNYHTVIFLNNFPKNIIFNTLSKKISFVLLFETNFFHRFIA